MSAVTVRQAVVHDLEFLAPLCDLYRQSQGRASNPAAAKEFLVARFAHSESFLFVGFDIGTPIGFACFYPTFSSEAGSRTFLLFDLFVSPVTRHHGVAAQLILAGAKHAQTLGAARLMLSCPVTSAIAQALEAEAGWVREGQSQLFQLKAGGAAAQA